MATIDDLKAGMAERGHTMDTIRSYLSSTSTAPSGTKQRVEPKLGQPTAATVSAAAPKTTPKLSDYAEKIAKNDMAGLATDFANLSPEQKLSLIQELQSMRTALSTSPTPQPASGTPVTPATPAASPGLETAIFNIQDVAKNKDDIQQAIRILQAYEKRMT